MRAALAGVIAVASIGYLAACGSDSPTGPQVGEIVVQPDSVSLIQLDSTRLDVSVLDTDGHLITGVSVTFTSQDTSRVKVSALGEVVSTGGAGKVNVEVKTNGATKLVPVVIIAKSGSIQVTPNPATVAQKGNVQLHGTVLDVTGAPIAGAQITYTSLNALATVNASGLVHSVGPAGTAPIQVNGGGLTTQVGVVITQVATSLQVGPPSLQLVPSANAAITATVLDAVGTPINGVTTTYHSENTAIATVSNAGVVHAVGPLGTGAIDVTAAGFSDTIPVTVIAVSHPQGQIAHTSTTEGEAFGVAISAAGVVYVAQEFGPLSRADLPDYTITTKATLSGQPLAVAFNSAGTLAYVAGAPIDGISVVQVSDNTVIKTATGLQENVFDVKLSQDGQIVYVATDSHVYALDVTTLAVLHQFNTDHAMIHLAVNPANGKVYASGIGTVDELDGTTLADLRSFNGQGLVQGIAVSSDGNKLYEAIEDGKFGTVDLTTGTVGTPLTTCGGYGLAISKDGLIAYMSCATAGKVEMIDLVNHAVLGDIATGGVPRRMAFNSTGLLLAVTNEGAWVDFIN